MEKETELILALIRKTKVIYAEIKSSAHNISHIKLNKNDLIMEVKRRPQDWQLCSFVVHNGELYVGYNECYDDDINFKDTT